MDSVFDLHPNANTECFSRYFNHVMENFETMNDKAASSRKTPTATSASVIRPQSSPAQLQPAPPVQKPDPEALRWCVLWM